MSSDAGHCSTHRYACCRDPHHGLGGRQHRAPAAEDLAATPAALMGRHLDVAALHHLGRRHDLSRYRGLGQPGACPMDSIRGWCSTLVCGKRPGAMGAGRAWHRIKLWGGRPARPARTLPFLAEPAVRRVHSRAGGVGSCGELGVDTRGVARRDDPAGAGPFRRGTVAGDEAGRGVRGIQAQRTAIYLPSSLFEGPRLTLQRSDLRPLQGSSTEPIGGNYAALL